MSYTRVICIVLLWSCINKEAILCFTIITYIWTASCDQLIHLNANVRVNPYYGMHWAYTASVHLISLTQKRHFSLLTAIAVKTWIHYRTKSLGVLRGSEHASSKAQGYCHRLTKYDPYFPVSTLQEMLFGCLQGLFEQASVKVHPTARGAQWNKAIERYTAKKWTPAFSSPLNKDPFFSFLFHLTPKSTRQIDIPHVDKNL